MINLPNTITLSRIILIPIMVFFYYMPFNWCRIAAALIFIVAAMTDWLDGYLARYLKLSSSLGAFLDPVADKLLVAVALVLLVADKNLGYLTIPAAIIIGREITISALREWMSELGKRTSVAVTFLGKLKTVLQMFAIALLLGAHSNFDTRLKILGYVTLYISAVLTIWSMFYYLQAAGLFSSNFDEDNLNI